MFERMLVPLDGSTNSEMVLPYVKEIASKFNSHVVLVRISEPAETIQECRLYLEGTAKRLQSEMKDRCKDNESEIALKVLTGNPAAEILNLSREIECNLIAMASRGVTGQPRSVLGNVADKIVRGSGYPVLLVRKAPEEQTISQKRLIKRIMVTLDGSRLSEAALPPGESLSRALGAEIILFRVIEPSLVAANPRMTLMQSTTQQYSDSFVANSIRPFVLAYMDSIEQSLTRTGLRASIAVREGVVPGQIVDYAAGNQIDLIVMSTHGWTGFGRWVFGSVTEQVIRTGDKPVMVVRPGEMY